MGSFDGAEICELVGLFILHKLSNIIPTKDLGLHRDDRLAVLRNKSGPEMERTRKNIIKAFQEIELNIAAETNLFQTDFQDEPSTSNQTNSSLIVNPTTTIYTSTTNPTIHHQSENSYQT